MKKIQSILFFLIMANFTFSQISNQSPVYGFNIKKKIIPPILDFVSNSVRFYDADGNKAINANENCYIEFKLKNSGNGNALNLIANLTASKNTQGLVFDSRTPISSISAGNESIFKININSNMLTQDGNVSFEIEIIEPNGFNTNKLNIDIDTRKFLAPKLEVVDCIVFSDAGTSTLELKKKFNVQFLVQNIGAGVANGVTLKLKIPANIINMSDEPEDININKLEPGEQKNIVYELIANAKYTDKTILIGLDLDEGNHQFAKNFQKTLNINQNLTQQKLSVPSQVKASKNIEVASLTSDVDKNIPERGVPNTKKYALIIGCEDYSKYQNTMEKEINVEFAENDARVVSEYAIKNMGYPNDQINLLINPTGSQINVAVDKLCKLIELEKGQAQIFFYYSGHGLPDQNTKLPYLIPVDATGNDLKACISLNDLYAKLSKAPSEKITVVLDACFSGAGRDKELIANKGARIKANFTVPANMIIFASSEGTESSAVYKEKQHGYFTYYFLKQLQLNKTNYKNLFDEVKFDVSKQALKIDSKTQTPSMIIGDNWNQDAKWTTLNW